MKIYFPSDTNIRASKILMRLSVGMSKKQDPRPETRDPSCGWDLGSETHDPIGGTQDPRPGTQKMGAKTRELGHLFFMGHLR